MDNLRQAFQSGRPVLALLPKDGYQNNKTVTALTDWVDFKLSEVSDKAKNFYKELSPDTAGDDSLDYLAYLCCLTGNYWDRGWSSQVKREMIRNSYPVLFRNRGQGSAIAKVLDIHGLTYSIWTPGSLNLTFSMPGVFGVPKPRLFVRLPITYPRTGRDFREAQRSLDNYAPAMAKPRAVYDQFYMGFSVLGDPMFSTASLPT